MVRVAISQADVFPGPLFELVTEDGIEVVAYNFAVVTVPGGHVLVHPHGFWRRRDAQEFAGAIADRGVINPDHWEEFIDPMDDYRDYSPEREKEDALAFEATGYQNVRRVYAPVLD